MIETKRLTPAARNNGALVVIDSRFPFGGKWSFLQQEAALLRAGSIPNNYESISYIALSSSIKASEAEEPIPDNARSIKLDRSFRKFYCAAYAALKMLSPEAAREWWNIRKLEHKPKLLVAIRQMYLYFAVYWRLRLCLRSLLETSSDLTTLYSYWLSAGAYACAKLKSKYPDTVVVARCHGGEVRDEKVYIPFRAIVDRELDEIFHIAVDRKNQYNRILAPIRNHGENRTAQSVAYLGVSTGGADSNIYDSEHARHEPLRVVSASNILSVKRIDLLIEALRLLGQDMPVVWWHFGDGALGRDIRRLADQRLAQRGNVKYEFRGVVQHSELLGFYRDHGADIFVNCSDSEGVPVSVMEALAQGIPAIARDVGGNSEVVVDGISGILVEETAGAEQIAIAISTLNNMRVDAEAYSGLRASARRLCESKFSSERNYREFYVRLIDLRKHRSSAKNSSPAGRALRQQ